MFKLYLTKYNAELRYNELMNQVEVSLIYLRKYIHLC